MARSDAKRLLQACNVYVSEGRNESILSRLQTLAGHQSGTVLLNTFTDKPYNRTGFTLASYSTLQLSTAAVTLARAALEVLDLRSHKATHPRVGVVDHISCHPLAAAASLQDASAVAKNIGQALGRGANGVPVFLYGSANQRNESLAEIRRRLGYFKSSSGEGAWEGALPAKLPSGTPPDFGPHDIPPASGVVLVGATPWVTNYNVLLATNDVDAVRRIAREVSGRGGGIPDVQAMALPHEGGVEVACNLLSAKGGLVDEVREAVCRLAGARGIDFVKAYVIGRTASEYIEMACQQLES